jgi:hypothetical protein
MRRENSKESKIFNENRLENRWHLMREGLLKLSEERYVV